MMKKTVFLVLTLILVACATQLHSPQLQIKVQQTGEEIKEKIIECFPDKRPGWVDSPPQSDGEYHYFVGVSKRTTFESAARDDAIRHAVNQFVSFCGIDVKLINVRVETVEGNTSLVLSSNVDETKADIHTAEAKVSGLKAKEWYGCKIRTYFGSTSIALGWESKSLMAIPVGEVGRVRRYAKEMNIQK